MLLLEILGKIIIISSILNIFIQNNSLNIKIDIQKLNIIVIYIEIIFKLIKYFPEFLNNFC